MTAREGYVFGGFTLDVVERRLTSRAGAARWRRKAHDPLVALVRTAGRLQTTSAWARREDTLTTE